MALLVAILSPATSCAAIQIVLIALASIWIVGIGEAPGNEMTWLGSLSLAELRVGLLLLDGASLGC